MNIFSDNGLMKVKRRMHKLNVAATYEEEKVCHCGRCTNFTNVEDEGSVMRKFCLIWFHFRCKSLKKAPKAAKFCHQCH